MSMQMHFDLARRSIDAGDLKRLKVVRQQCDAQDETRRRGCSPVHRTART
jgi:hypothetical protein